MSQSTHLLRHSKPLPQAMARKLDKNINVVSEISDDTLTKIKADDIRLSQN